MEKFEREERDHESRSFPVTHPADPLLEVQRLVPGKLTIEGQRMFNRLNAGVKKLFPTGLVRG